MLEQSNTFEPGTAKLCMDIMDQLDSKDQGWCVGDDQTKPDAGTFDDSPFSINRGFDMVVPTTTMVIEYTTSHGTPSGNENVDGEAVLDAVRQVVAEL